MHYDNPILDRSNAELAAAVKAAEPVIGRLSDAHVNHIGLVLTAEEVQLLAHSVQKVTLELLSYKQAELIEQTLGALGL